MSTGTTQEVNTCLAGDVAPRRRQSRQGACRDLIAPSALVRLAAQPP
jgi:hypothetical protein